MLALLLVDSRRSFFLKESFIRRMFLPVLAACILPLFFLPETLWAGPCVLAFLFSLLPYSSALFATCEHIVRCGLSSMRTFGWARLFSSAGLLLGLSAGWLAFSTEVLGSVTLPVMVVVVVMVLHLGFGGHKQAELLPRESQEPAQRIVIGPRGEMMLEASCEDAESGVRFFHLKCDAVAKQCGLSKRQTEVLHMLAKGRNAEYVQQKLVISMHTAKTHIANIYHKLGVHSSQEMLSLIESSERKTSNRKSRTDKPISARAARRFAVHLGRCAPPTVRSTLCKNPHPSST